MLHTMMKISVAALTALVCAASVAQASNVFAGKKIYEQHCQRCHGDHGIPILPGSPDFSKGDGLHVTDRKLFSAIKAGKNVMPAYNKVISERDILNVVAYIRTLWR